MKQIIEIEVPEGKKAIWKNNRIEFEDIDSFKNIKSVEDAYDELKCIDSFIATRKLKLLPLIKLQVVLKAVNEEVDRSLTDGRVWYPLVRFFRKDKVDKYKLNNEEIIQDFAYKNVVYTLVGGYADLDCENGLGSFYSNHGGVSSLAGLLSCKSKEIAEYVSRNFAKLIFEAIIGYKLEGIQWL